jgi:hypothetical protein
LEGTLAASITANPAAGVAPLNGSNIQVGQTTQGVATSRDSTGNPIPGRSVPWSNANPAVATVSSQGLVATVAPSTFRHDPVEKLSIPSNRRLELESKCDLARRFWRLDVAGYTVRNRSSS